MSGQPIVFATNQSQLPRMTLSASGNLGIGTSAAHTNPSITVGAETITPELIKSIKHIHAFMDYAAKTDHTFGELWTAFNAAQKLE